MKVKDIISILDTNRKIKIVYVNELTGDNDYDGNSKNIPKHSYSAEVIRITPAYDTDKFWDFYYRKKGAEMPEAYTLIAVKK